MNLLDAIKRKLQSLAGGVVSSVKKAIPVVPPKQISYQPSFGTRAIVALGKSPIGQGIVNFQRNIESRTLPKINLQPYAEKIQAPIPRFGAKLAGGIAENILNIPQRLLEGGGRAGMDIRTALSGGKLTPARLIGTGASVVEPLVDIVTLGGGTLIKKTGQQALKEAGKQTLKQVIKRGALRGAGYGAAYGGLHGLTLGDEANVGNFVTNLGVGGLIGTGIGGITAGIGGLLGMIKRTPEVELQLRDSKGRWTKGQIPIKPKGMPKPQWEFQLKFNEKYGRNPYEPVYNDDLVKAINKEAESRVGLQVRPIKGTISEAEEQISKSAQLPEANIPPKKVGGQYGIKAKSALSGFVETKPIGTLEEAKKALAYRESIGVKGGKIVEIPSPSTGGVKPVEPLIPPPAFGAFQKDFDRHVQVVKILGETDNIPAIGKLPSSTDVARNLGMDEVAYMNQVRKTAGLPVREPLPAQPVLPKTLAKVIKPPSIEEVKPIEPIKPVKPMIPPPPLPPAGVPPTPSDPVKIVIDAIKGAKPTREAQEALYTQIRGQKIAGAEAIGQRLEGEAGFYKKLGIFKGEMPKVKFESIKDKVGQEVKDTLFNKIETSNINEWDKLPAGKGLAKLFGEYGGQVPTRGELDLLDKVFGRDLVDTILTKRSMGEKLSDWFGQAVTIPKALLATADFSMPFRQAIFFIGRPKQFIPAFKEQFKYFFSEKALNQATKETASRPTFKSMQDSKLSLTNLGTDLTKREEQFMSTWAEKIPIVGRVVRASTRAAVGFLNKLRADVFDDMYRNAERAGRDPANDPKLLKDIANLINRGTGRGGLGPFERTAVVLNQTLFSPRLVASRLQLLNPGYYINPKLDPFVRKEALKTLFGTTSIIMTTLALAKLNGVDVEVDPRSADFAKIKTGNTRYEITGGFSQYIRLAAQLLSGKIVSSTTGREYTLGEGYKPLTRYDILQRFFEYKEAPILSFATELLRGKNVFGGEPEWGKEVANRFIPMIIQDTQDLIKDRGMAGLFMATPGIFGVGVQTYTEAESIKNMMSDKQKEEYKIYGEPYIDVISKNKDIDYESGKLKKLYDEGKPLTPDISLKTKSEFLYNQLKEAQSYLKYGRKAEAQKIISDLKKSELWTPEVKQRVSILDQTDEAGLTKTDRLLMEYQGKARAIKIKENLDGMKDPKNQAKKLKLLIESGIVDAETKQALQELYGIKVGKK